MKKFAIMTVLCVSMALCMAGTGYAIASGGCVVEEKKLMPMSSETEGGCVVNEEKIPLQTADQESIEVTLTEAAQNIEMAVGATLKVIIAGNPTTGYIWEIEDFKPSLLELSDRSFVSAAAGNDENPMVGVGGNEVFTFRAKKTGESSITFWYKRPWETTEPEKIQILNVKIK